MTPSTRLVGRETERRSLEDVLEDVRASRGRSLVLVGEAGIGKSALLDHIAGSARDMHVVRAAGDQIEHGLQYAALHLLFSPMVESVDRLPSRQRTAVRTAFGFDAGVSPDGLAVAAGVLSLIHDLAREQPVLCIIDDEQWLDRASRRVLTFVARRLEAEPVGVVFAARTPSREVSALPTLPVAGLPLHRAAELLDRCLVGRLDPEVRRRVLHESNGNPLSLVELARGTTPAELAGGFGLPGGPPPPARLEAYYQRRLECLDLDARQWLTIAAADPVGGPDTLWAAARHAGLGPRAAESAIGSGLLRVDLRVQFTHPHARSAVYRAADVLERRAAHDALAAATDPGADPDRRAWHRAHAVSAPADEIADELENVAVKASGRGGVAAAAAFVQRAAVLTSGREHRARRTLAAAEAHSDAGALDWALDLLEAADPGKADDVHRGRVMQVRGQIALQMRRNDDAVDDLLDAAELLSLRWPAQAAATYLDALCTAMGTSDPDRRLLGRVVDAIPVTSASGDDIPFLVLAGLLARVAKGYRAAVLPMTRALEASLTAQADTAGRLRLLRATLTLSWEMWDGVACRLLTERMVAAAGEQGALASLPVALGLEAFRQIATGDLAAAIDNVERAKSIVAATGAQPDPGVELVLAAWLDDEQRCSDIGRRVRRQQEISATSAVAFADHADAVMHNAHGRFDAALRSAGGMFEMDVISAGTHIVTELADAASRTGAVEVLQAAHTWLWERAETTGGDWVQGVAERVRAFLADKAGEPHYLSSIEHLARTQMRPELARSYLAYGEWLRRQGRRGAARQHLTEAHALFNAMGASAFAARAARELNATGYSRLDCSDPPERPSLTAQESQVAVLARAGLSNPEIGQRLFISRRTVQYHLRKVFIKLEITSREHLARAYPATEQVGSTSDSPSGPSTDEGRRARRDRELQTGLVPANEHRLSTATAL